MRIYITILLCWMTHWVQGQLFQIDTIPDYAFLNLQSNKIGVLDSTTLENFYFKLWRYENKNQGQVEVLHIGDSHIQAGYLTGTVREAFHKSFGCGTRERGFVFPFGMAHTNGPINYGAKYTGAWQGCRSTYRYQDCPWGLAGIVAKTSDDSTTLKIYSNNHTFDPYFFNKVKIMFRDDSSAFNIDLKANNTVVINQRILPEAHAMEFYLKEETDTVYFTFKKDSTKEKGDFYIQGIVLENDRPGITYSEVGVNGAKVSSYLSCPDFDQQLSLVNPDLIILSLGTNDTYNTTFNDTLFFQQYDSLLAKIAVAVPEANIILCTPPDFKRQRRYDVPENLLARRTVLALAQKYNCGVWDNFQVMGGFKSMEQWFKNRLSARDYVHFNAKGYELQGQLLFNAIISGYEDFTAEKRSKSIYVNEGPNWQKLKEYFLFYSPKDPWIFSTSPFWVAFAIMMIIYSFLYKNTKWRALYLFLFSLFFYYKSSGFYFGLLLFSTVADYLIGWRIADASKPLSRKLWLTLSITVNLLVLGFFKYSGFVLDQVNLLFQTNYQPVNVFNWTGNMLWDGGFDIYDLFLPVGISFYTFQTISYAVDVYRKELPPVKNIIDFGFYVSFFPQLVAGPIVRAKDFIPQIHRPYQLTKRALATATYLILGGLFKKIVISDYISVNFVDRVFDSPIKYSGFENLLGVYGYSLQIFCDFSAYSDIAIGVALLLGFNLPENFNHPYRAINITDFWRRWHISLSTWLKDYLYIPLGGNRKGKIRTYVNLMITMLLGGLWHGAAFRFILWGGLHGIALAIHKRFQQVFPNFKGKQSFWSNTLFAILTFHFVAFCWILFRIPDMQHFKDMMHQFYFEFHPELIIEILFGYKEVMLVMLLGYLIHFIPKKWNLKLEHLFYKTGYTGYALTSIIIVLIVYQFKTSGIQPFIYFQF